MSSPSPDPTSFLESIEGEIAFFRSIMRARPVGIHRYFHVLTIRNAIQKETGHLVTSDAIWMKLRSCYALDVLETLDTEGYDTPNSNKSPPLQINSPSPSDDLFSHPYFKEEYTLPTDDSYESLIAARRMRGTASLPSSSPEPSPPRRVKSRTGKRGKSKISMAGLVGGDSDSSALTQESGDEGVAPTPRESVMTGTDGGTDYAEDEDVEMHGSSPAPSIASKPARVKASRVSKKNAVAGRTRATLGTTTRLAKKKKK